MNDITPWSARLARLAEHSQGIAESRDLAELKEIADFAVAAKEYARAKKLGEEAQSYAQEIINRSTRRIGELLADVPMAPRGLSKTAAVEDLESPRERIGWKTSHRSQRLAAIPQEVFEQHASKPITRLERIARDHKAAEARAKPVEPVVVVDDIDIRHGDFRQVLADLAGVDAIITDPPYPAEYLPLFGDLAEFADHALKPSGVLAVMSGQTHLDRVFQAMEGYRPYRWTACYLTAGAGYVAHQARVQTNWKPVLIYGGGPRFADLFSADNQSEEDKAHHKWGQNVEGFRQLVERLTKPGDLVVDPFVGGGTTALVCKLLGRRFIGCDLDAAAIQETRDRLKVA